MTNSAAGRYARAGLLALACLWLAAPALAGEAPLNLWPVYDDRVDPVDGSRVRSSLGPLFELERDLDEPVQSYGLRPLFYRLEDARHDTDQAETDVLYPVFTYRRSDRDWQWQFLLLLNGRSEGPPAERERRFDLFPFYFSGTTEAGESYRAVLPFGGTAVDRLGQDRLTFVLFPLYARFLKGQTETTYTPWPLISRVRGEREGFRIVPFYGAVRQPGVSETRFVLWPLYLSQRAGLNTDNPEETLALLPFYVRQRAPRRDSTTVLWPFFTHTHDRERGYEQWDAPWPLVQVARGEGKRVTRVLPLFSVEERRLRNEFLLRELTSRQLILLFPLYIRTQDDVPGTRTVRDRVLWWLYSDTRQTGQDGEARRLDAWPLFRYERDREGAVRFQALALLEPLLPGNEWIERNYSPLWSLYTFRRSPAGAEVHSFLWNLVRHEETPAGRSIEVLGPVVRYREAESAAVLSLFGGLVEYQVTRGVRSVRLLGREAARWEGLPQPVAVLAAEGGGR
ncbi:MAG: hypothetical protein ACE147_04745 [Candidatus Methylomirabilales bacterium]